jgi:hypothetical protein
MFGPSTDEPKKSILKQTSHPDFHPVISVISRYIPKLIMQLPLPNNNFFFFLI